MRGRGEEGCGVRVWVMKQVRRSGGEELSLIHHYPKCYSSRVNEVRVGRRGKQGGGWVGYEVGRKVGKR